MIQIVIYFLVVDVCCFVFLYHMEKVSIGKIGVRSGMSSKEDEKLTTLERHEQLGATRLSPTVSPSQVIPALMDLRCRVPPLMSLVVFPSFCFAPAKMSRPATKSISAATQVAAISPASKTTSMSSATQTVSISPASKTTSISPASKITSTSSDTPPTPASADTDHLAELQKTVRHPGEKDVV